MIDHMRNQMGEIEGEFKETTSLVPVSKADTYLPALTLDEADKRYTMFKTFVASQMMDGKDYGTIPGTAKPTLYKPGAEKLTTFFGMTVKFVSEKTIEDFDKPLFFYRVKCQLWRGEILIAEASGSCNSMEDRYAWRWVQAQEVPPEMDKTKLAKKVSSIGEWRWAYDKRATSGQYGKPEEYWQKFDKAIETGIANISAQQQHWDGKYSEYIEIETSVYRIPNENVFTLVNTILKMAEKRALVAATLIGCNASEFFTQDMEDIVDLSFDVDAPVIETTPKQTKPEQPKEKPKAKPKATQSKLNLPQVSEDLSEQIIDAAVKADKGEFPASEYVDFCKALGYGRQSSEILNENDRDFNKAVLHVIQLFEGDTNFVLDKDVDDIPF